MSIDSNLQAEIDLLNLFDLNSIQQGLKVHHEAEQERIAAAERLFRKGMITLVDGGYLTDRGLEAAEHAKALLGVLQDAQEA